MNSYYGLFIDVGYPKDKPPYPKNLPFPYVNWTQMLIPDRFREFVNMRYENGSGVPCVISWYKKMQKDEDWVNWFADQAGLPRPLHFFHNNQSLNRHTGKSGKAKNKKSWNSDSTEQLFGE